MEIFGGFLIFFAIGVISYLYIRKKQIDEETIVKSTLHASSMVYEQQKAIKEQITQRVDSFLKEAQYFNFIGTFKKQKVYQYIYNDGYLYEFKDFMDAKNHKVGMSENELCFKQMSYARVENPTEFLKKFNVEPKNSET